MNVSVEISMYPLIKQYREPIKNFIDRISNHSEILIDYGKMSSTLFGDYHVIMPLLEHAIETTLKEVPQSVFIIKLSGGCH